MTTVMGWYESGGPFMLPMLVVALAGLALLIERSAHIVKRSRVNARPFMEHVIALTRAQRLDEALSVCARHQAALADLGLVLLRSRSTSPDDLAWVADAARKSFAPTLGRRLNWLVALAAVALLLGVAGTVANLDALPAREAGGMAAGELALALHPLGAAAMVAAVLLLGHAVLANQVRTLGSQLEEFSVRLLNALAGRPEVRLGHRE
jgi:biopolymer transport protein ExbB